MFGQVNYLLLPGGDFIFTGFLKELCHFSNDMHCDLGDLNGSFLFCDVIWNLLCQGIGAHKVQAQDTGVQCGNYDCCSKNVKECCGTRKMIGQNPKAICKHLKLLLGLTLP